MTHPNPYNRPMTDPTRRRSAVANRLYRNEFLVYAAATTSRVYAFERPAHRVYERIGMVAFPRYTAVFATGILAATVWAGSAWADGPGGVVEPDGDISVAVGSGVLDVTLVGFTATGPTNEAASAAVIAACQQAGALDCSRDEVTNDNLCIVSVGASDGSGVVAGGSGPTVETARDDAFRHAQEANAPLDPGARTLASACP